VQDGPRGVRSQLIRRLCIPAKFDSRCGTLITKQRASRTRKGGIWNVRWLRWNWTEVPLLWHCPISTRWHRAAPHWHSGSHLYSISTYRRELETVRIHCLLPVFATLHTMHPEVFGIGGKHWSSSEGLGLNTGALSSIHISEDCPHQVAVSISSDLAIIVRTERNGSTPVLSLWKQRHCVLLPERAPSPTLEDSTLAHSLFAVTVHLCGTVLCSL